MRISTSMLRRWFVPYNAAEEALNLLQKGEYSKVSNRIKSMLAKLSLELHFK